MRDPAFGPNGYLDWSLGASGIPATYLIRLPRNNFMRDFPTHPSYIVPRCGSFFRNRLVGGQVFV